MNPSDHHHDPLLGDLFDGPDVETVMAAIRREKAAAQRRRRFAAGAAITAFAVTALSFSLRERSSEMQSIAHVLAPEPAAPARLEEADAFPEGRMSDEQLIALLEGHPVALVQLPSGKQQLLLVEDHGDGESASIISL